MESDQAAANQPNKKRYWRNLGLFALLSGAGIAALLVFGGVFFAAYRVAHPPRAALCCQTPADFGLAYEEAAIQTEDGLTLRGWYLPSQNRAGVILMHGWSGTRLMLLQPAVALAREGYGVLMLDLRAHGESDGELIQYGDPQVKDVRAALSYLQGREDLDPQRIGIMGWSLGGMQALLGTAQLAELRAVLVEGAGGSTIGDWPEPNSLQERLERGFYALYLQGLYWLGGVGSPLAMREALPRIAGRPLLLISTGEGGEQQLAARFFALAGEPKQRWNIPEAGHLGAWAARPQAYAERMISFFDQALLGE